MLSFADNTYSYSTYTFCKNSFNVIHGPFSINLTDSKNTIFFSLSDKELFPVNAIFISDPAELDCQPAIFDSYPIEGGNPQVDSVFAYPVNNEKHIFVIISWEVNSRGDGTYGKYYQVYSYHCENNGLVLNNKLMSLSGMSGMDGYSMGEEVYFKNKTSQQVKDYIRNLNIN